jgi:hypothetical protein
MRKRGPRHPDFASFAVRIGWALGREDEAIAALRAAEADKSIFCLENDAVGAVIVNYVRAAGEFKGTAAELMEKLPEGDFDADRLTAKGLGKRISSLWPHIQAVFPGSKRETDRKGFTILTALWFGFLEWASSRLWIKPEDAQLLIAATGFRDARSPCDGLLARGQFQDGETAVERWRPWISSIDNSAVGRNTHRRHIFVDAAAKNVDAGGLRLVNHGVSVAAHCLPFAIRHYHRRTRKRNQIFGHTLFLWG